MGMQKKKTQYVFKMFETTRTGICIDNFIYRDQSGTYTRFAFKICCFAPPNRCRCFSCFFYEDFYPMTIITM